MSRSAMCERGELAASLLWVVRLAETSHEALVDCDSPADADIGSAVGGLVNILRQVRAIRTELQLPPEPDQPPEELCECMACRAWVRAAGGAR